MSGTLAIEAESDDDDSEDLGVKLARMAKASRAQWLTLVTDLIKIIASRKAEITSDDVWFFLEGSNAVAPIVDGRLLGAAFNDAKRHGILSVVDRVQPSTRPVCHRRPIRIWESRIVGNRPKVCSIAHKLFDSKKSKQ